MKKAGLSILCLMLLSAYCTAQEKWNLERCVREALAKNLTIKQVKLNKQGYDLNRKQYRMERLPSLNANSNIGVNFGRFVNPSTNNFETENSFYQGLGFNSGVTLFNGFRITNSIRQNDFYISAASEDIKQAENDLALNVALSYLNVLFAYENLTIANDRVALSQQQLVHMDKLIQAGVRPENDRYDILAQIAIDDQSLITAQNNIEINLLSLKQQMLMESDYPLEIERPLLDLSTLEALENQAFEAVYSAALTSQPQIHASELRQKASELGVNIARSQMMPSLTLGGNIGSNWSDVAKEPAGFILQRIPQSGVFINGESALFEVESEIPTALNPIPYGRQLDNNIGYGVGATLSIPIFNNFRNKNGVERAKINVINSSIESDQIKQTLKTNIQNALTSAKASRKSLAGAEASALAAKVALENADRKSALGSLSNFEYLSARNRYDAAQNNLLIAKYDYYFKIKIIEYYLGRGMRLN